MRRRKLTKAEAIKVMTLAACLLKDMNKPEIDFREFEQKYQSKKKFLKDFKTALRKFASKPVKFLDPEGEAMIYADLEAKKFRIKRVK